MRKINVLTNPEVIIFGIKVKRPVILDSDKIKLDQYKARTRLYLEKLTIDRVIDRLKKHNNK